MSEKLSERMGLVADTLDAGPTIWAQTFRAYATEVATLECALAEMTRQRDEALKWPTATEQAECVGADNPLGYLIAARRKRILGDA